MTSQSPELASAPPGTLCVGCGYGVGLMPTNAICPECTTPVATSLRGDLLGNANPEYVRSIALGLSLVILGSLVTMSWWIATPIVAAVFIGQRLISAQGGFVIIQSIDFFGAILLLAGWWLASSPNPAVQDPARDIRTRRILRWLLLVIAGITAVGFIGLFVPAFANTGLAGVSGNINVNTNNPIPPLLAVAIGLRFLLVGAKVARFFVGLLYLRVLAERIPDSPLAQSVKRQCWLFPVLMTAGWAILVGPIVGVWMYLVMLVRAQRTVARAAANRR